MAAAGWLAGWAGLAGWLAGLGWAGLGWLGWLAGLARLAGLAGWMAGQLPLATDGAESLLHIKYLVVVWVLSICDLLFLLIFDILFIYMFWWGYRE